MLNICQYTAEHILNGYISRIPVSWLICNYKYVLHHGVHHLIINIETCSCYYKYLLYTNALINIHVLWLYNSCCPVSLVVNVFSLASVGFIQQLFEFRQTTNC